MTAPQTRDPLAYRREKRTEAIKAHREVTRCYEEYTPPQIRHGMLMQQCSGHMGVLPFHPRRTDCLAIHVDAEPQVLCLSA